MAFSQAMHQLRRAVPVLSPRRGGELERGSYSCLNTLAGFIRATPGNIGVFQHYFFSEHFALRLDFKNFFTSEDKQRYRVQGLTRDPKLPGGTVNDTMLTAGVTFWY